MATQEAYSRLKAILDAQGLTTADLVRRVQEQGDRINAKSIYRLADPRSRWRRWTCASSGVSARLSGRASPTWLTFHRACRH